MMDTIPTVPPASGHHEVPERARSWRPEETYVPPDRRWAGMDRDTIGPSLVVVALLLLMAFVLPAIDHFLAFNDPIVEGELIRVRGATFAPPPGWGLVKGKRAGTSNTPTYPAEAELEKDGVTFRVEYAAYGGKADELLQDVLKTNAALSRKLNVLSQPMTMKTSAGMRGVVAKYGGASSNGIIAAFVFDGKGVTAIATGSTDLLTAQVAHDVTQMILSLTPVPETAP